jgi:phospholipase D-like protein/putative oligomerization/nucleic acid binding protein
MFAATWGTGQVAYSILWFFLFFVEIWLAISVFIDIFRSHDLKGWAKALWIILVFVAPIIGILAYLLFRGDKMRVHQIEAAQEQDLFARSVFPGGGRSTADEISKLVELKSKGEITEAEFEQLKAHAIADAQRVHSA